MSAVTDLTGRTFGKLTVAGRAENYISPGGVHISRWDCLCACGGRLITRADSLRNGRTASCGCAHRERAAGLNRTHGLSHSLPEYEIWKAIKQRCTNPRCKDYPGYGGRGIVMCWRWSESFETFLADMGRKPGTKYSIDRIDNDGDYEPSNCRWATSKEQSANKRRRS